MLIHWIYIVFVGYRATRVDTWFYWILGTLRMKIGITSFSSDQIHIGVHHKINQTALRFFLINCDIFELSNWEIIYLKSNMVLGLIIPRLLFSKAFLATFQISTLSVPTFCLLFILCDRPCPIQSYSNWCNFLGVYQIFKLTHSISVLIRATWRTIHLYFLYLNVTPN